MITAGEFAYMTLPLAPATLLTVALALEFLVLHLARGARRKRD